MTSPWLKSVDLCALTGWSKRTLQHKAKSGEISWRHGHASTRNGKREREYSVASLPVEHQFKLLSAGAAGGLVSARPENSPHEIEPSLFLAPVQIPEAMLIAASPAQEKQMRERADTIAPMITFRDNAKFQGSIVRLANGRQVRSLDECARYVAEQHQIGIRTVWRWYKKFQRGGASALLTKPRSDRARSRFFHDENNEAVAKFVLAKFAEGRYGYSYIHGAMIREWGNFHLGAGVSPPSYQTVKAYIESVPAAVRDAVRLNREQYDSKYAPFLKTDIAALRVNQIWVADHRIYNVFAQNDCFTELPKLARVRLWVTAIEDMRSRAIVGAVWGVSPSSRTIGSAFRIAILRFGVPDIFYCDNGKDFRKVGGPGCAEFPLNEEGKIELDVSSRHLMERLGVRTVYCKPRHPQSKMIESYFSTVSKNFDVLWGAALRLWIGEFFRGSLAGVHYRTDYWRQTPQVRLRGIVRLPVCNTKRRPDRAIV